MLQKDGHGDKKRAEEGVEILPRKTENYGDSEHEGTGAGQAANKLEGASRNIVRDKGDEVTGNVTQSEGEAQHTRDQGYGKPRPTNAYMREIYDRVAMTGVYNHVGARVPIPSGLNVQAWKQYLEDYRVPNLVMYLEYGWPINFDREQPLVSTFQNHPSARRYPEDVEHYIDTELGLGALLGPFRGPPVRYTHISPLMTKPKKDAKFRRVIMDLSWPDGASNNDGVDGDKYVEGPASITLPTVDFMEARLLTLGPGAYTYKTDLPRGYRQLRVDPSDWPVLGFKHEGQIYIDVCPPLGLKYLQCVFRGQWTLFHSFTVRRGS